MSNKEKLIEKLLSTKGGTRLVDIKFSLGFDRKTTEEEFCGEVISALEQVEAGASTRVPVSQLDGNFKLRTTSEFLK